MTVVANSPAPVKKRGLSGDKILAAVKAAGVEYILSVPDLHTSEGLLRRAANSDDFKLIRVCKEDECLGIATGLSYRPKRALTLIQYTGFLYSINAVRALACEHKMPIAMMIGLLAKEPDVAPKNSKKWGLTIVEPILDVMGIEHHYIDVDEDIPKIQGAINKAYTVPGPVAFLIGRRPV